MISESDAKPNPAQVAKYISDIVAELAAMARGAEEDGLGYILEMARLEADEVVRRHGARN